RVRNPEHTGGASQDSGNRDRPPGLTVVRDRYPWGRRSVPDQAPGLSGYFTHLTRGGDIPDPFPVSAIRRRIDPISTMVGDPDPPIAAPVRVENQSPIDVRELPPGRAIGR